MINFPYGKYRTERSEQKQKLWFGHVFLAGCTGGVVKAICACPIELSKVRLQVKVSKLMNTKNNIILLRVNRLYITVEMMFFRPGNWTANGVPPALPTGRFLWAVSRLERYALEVTQILH